MFGPFRITLADGTDVTPVSKRCAGLFGLLCRAPDFRRSRSWLASKLWCAKDEEAVDRSFRQELYAIRERHDVFRQLFVATRGSLELDSTLFEIVEPGADAHKLEFLEGLHINGEIEFQNWLRDERAEIAKEQAMRPCLIDTPIVSGQNERRPRLVISSLRSDANGASGLLADGLAGLISRTISDGVKVDVLMGSPADDDSSYADPVRTDIDLIATTNPERTLTHITLQERTTKLQIWSELVHVTPEMLTDDLPEGILRTVSTSSNVALGWMINELSTQGSEMAAYRRGLAHMRRHTMADFRKADAEFERAFIIAPKAVYLAWRAYLRSFLAAELVPTNLDIIEEEARTFIIQALEAEPTNSLVLSLCAQCEAFVFLSFVNAHELAQQSVDINPANALGWACLGVAASHLGDHRAGLDHCRKARAIAGASPFRGHIDLLCCVVAIMAGDLKDARYFGEAAHGRLPHLAAPLRFLTALLFHQRDEDAAQSAMNKLQVLEPGFEISHLRDPSYPSQSLQKSAIIASLPGKII